MEIGDVVEYQGERGKVKDIVKGGFADVALIKCPMGTIWVPTSYLQPWVEKKERDWAEEANGGET